MPYKDPEEAKKRAKTYYERNKEKIALSTREYRQTNKNIINERSRQYYAKNKEKIAEYWVENKERIKEYRKIYYAENKERINLRNREYRSLNKERVSISNRDYYKTNTSYFKDYFYNYRKLLPLSMVAKEHGLQKPTTEGELALLEILRYNTLTKRLIKEAKNEHPRRA